MVASATSVKNEFAYHYTTLEAEHEILNRRVLSNCNMCMHSAPPVASHLTFDLQLPKFGRGMANVLAGTESVCSRKRLRLEKQRKQL